MVIKSENQVLRQYISTIQTGKLILFSIYVALGTWEIKPYPLVYKKVIKKENIWRTSQKKTLGFQLPYRLFPSGQLGKIV